MLATYLALTALAAAPVDPAAPPTFSRDIAPILQRSCQDCHRPGEAAPMPLLTYADARPHARSIKKAVSKREMPPWHADPAHGTWKNAMRLEDPEIAAISAWVDAGAPEGDPKELPPPRQFTEGWAIGKPDQVFTIPREFTVPTQGTVKYQYFFVPTEFTEDRWVQKAEARPGNRAVVHHIIVFVLGPDEMSLDDKKLWQSHLCGTAPGSDADVFPEGTAKLIPRGANLLFQLHYTPNGKVEKDRSSVGLIFATKPVRKQFRVQGIMNNRFRIPPGASAHEVRSSYTFREDSTILSLMPHMHLRGKSFRYDLEMPGGRSVPLLSVPRYDFNWQHSYVPIEPIKAPRGTRIHCTALFDNSSANKANPDPTKEVRWGDQTWEEMMIGFLNFTMDGEDLLDTGAPAQGF